MTADKIESLITCHHCAHSTIQQNNISQKVD